MCLTTFLMLVLWLYKLSVETYLYKPNILTWWGCFTAICGQIQKPFQHCDLCHDHKVFTVGDEGAVRSTCPLGEEEEKEEEEEEERWKFGWQQWVCMWQLWPYVTIVITCDNCDHMWQLWQHVTIVTACDNCVHICQLCSYVTIVTTCDNCDHMW